MKKFYLIMCFHFCSIIVASEFSPDDRYLSNDRYITPYSDENLIPLFYDEEDTTPSPSMELLFPRGCNFPVIDPLVEDNYYQPENKASRSKKRSREDFLKVESKPESNSDDRLLQSHNNNPGITYQSSTAPECNHLISTNFIKREHVNTFFDGRKLLPDSPKSNVTSEKLPPQKKIPKLPADDSLEHKCFNLQNPTDKLLAISIQNSYSVFYALIESAYEGNNGATIKSNRLIKIADWNQWQNRTKVQWSSFSSRKKVNWKDVIKTLEFFFEPGSKLKNGEIVMINQGFWPQFDTLNRYFANRSKEKNL